MNLFKHLPLRQFNVRLLLLPAFGVAIVVALWSVVVYQLALEKRAVLAVAVRNLDGYVASFEQHTLNSIRDADHTLALVKYQMESTGNVDLRFMQARGLLHADGFIQINVFDPTGRLVAGSQEFDLDSVAIGRGLLLKHASDDSGSLDISAPGNGRFSGKPSIQLSRRLTAADGSFAGVVALAVDPAYFTSFYRESELGTGGSLGLMGLDGAYRARRAGNIVALAPGVNNTTILAHAQSSPSGAYEGISPVDGVHRLVAYRRLSGYPLLVVAARSKDELFAPYVERRTIYASVAGAASLVILAFFGVVTFLALRIKHDAAAFQSHQSFLQKLIDSIPVGIGVRSMRADTPGRYTMWNAYSSALFGVSREAVLGRTVADVMPAQTTARTIEWDREMLASPGIQHADETVPDAGKGTPRRVLRKVRAPIFAADGSVESIVTITTDVTGEQAASDKLRLASKVFETTADGIVLTDANDHIIMVNAALTRLTGFAPEELLGKRLSESPFRPVDAAASAARMEQLERQGFVTGEVRRMRKDGHELQLWVTATCVRGDDDSTINYVRVFTDISPLKEAQRKLERIAHRDVLTGLPNRRLFAETLEHALKRTERSGQCGGLIFLDLDGFKDVNDTHGHDVGDLLLQGVVRRLQDCVRSSDTLCRLGGDEFTIILENAAASEHATAVGTRILEALAAPLVVRGCILRVGASIGITFFPSDGADCATLLRNADIAMYRAKDAGGNRVEFHRPGFLAEVA